MKNRFGENLKYVVAIVVNLLLDIAVFAFSFFVPGMFGVVERGDTTAAQAVVVSFEDAENGPVLYVTEGRFAPEDEETFSCVLRVAPRALTGEGALAHLSEGAVIVFYTTLDEEEILTAEQVPVVALAVTEGTTEYAVASLDAYNAEGNQKVTYTVAGCFAAAVVFFLAAGYCLLKMCGFFQKRKW